MSSICAKQNLIRVSYFSVYSHFKHCLVQNNRCSAEINFVFRPLASRFVACDKQANFSIRSQSLFLVLLSQARRVIIFF